MDPINTTTIRFTMIALSDKTDDMLVAMIKSKLNRHDIAWNMSVERRDINAHIEINVPTSQLAIAVAVLKEWI